MSGRHAAAEDRRLAALFCHASEPSIIQDACTHSPATTHRHRTSYTRGFCSTPPETSAASVRRDRTMQSGQHSPTHAKCTPVGDETNRRRPCKREERLTGRPNQESRTTSTKETENGADKQTMCWWQGVQRLTAQWHPGRNATLRWTAAEATNHPSYALFYLTMDSR